MAQVQDADMDGPSRFVRVLCELEECTAYRLPPKTKSRGYLAEEMKRLEVCFTGPLRVRLFAGAEDDRCVVELLQPDGSLFAACVVSGGGGGGSSDSGGVRSVERCADSSRYFALRLVSKEGRTAYLGVAFAERAAAFDFYACVSEFETKRQRNAAASEAKETATTATTEGALRDLSLKEGQTIRIQLGSGESNRATTTTIPSAPAPATTQPSGLLGPPPSSGTPGKARPARGQRKPQE